MYIHIVYMYVHEIIVVFYFLDNGSDYQPGPFNATIKKGQKSAKFQVEIYNDKVYENGNDDNGEDFSLEIIADSLKSDSDVHLGSISKTKVIIVDDECKYD